jgi:hypothetical protein
MNPKSDHGFSTQITEIFEEIDRLAEAGLCQFSSGGRGAFLQDIRNEIAKLGIQGGLTENKS